MCDDDDETLLGGLLDAMSSEEDSPVKRRDEERSRLRRDDDERQEEVDKNRLKMKFCDGNEVKQRNDYRRRKEVDKNRLETKFRDLNEVKQRDDNVDKNRFKTKFRDCNEVKQRDGDRRREEMDKNRLKTKFRNEVKRQDDEDSRSRTELRDSDSKEDDELLGGLLGAVSSEEEKQQDRLEYVKSKIKQRREHEKRRAAKASPAFGVTKQLPRMTWPKGKTDVERFSNLRIKNRKVSAEEMERNMVGRTFYAMKSLKNHRKTLLNDDADNLDWVTVGVLSEKSKRRLTSSTKSGVPRKYSIWTLDDLDGTCVTLFLHRLAYGTTTSFSLLVIFGSNNSNTTEKHWDVPVGAIVALVSPKCLASRTGFDDKRFAISVNDAERVIILGHSKDYARCKATRKDGKPCNKAVNATKCGYCEFHIASRFKYAKSKRGFSSGASAKPTKKKIVPSSSRSVHLSQNGVYTMKSRHGISFRVERQGHVRVQDSKKQKRLMQQRSIQRKGQHIQNALLKIGKNKLTTGLRQVSGMLRNGEFGQLKKGKRKGDLLQKQMTIKRNANVTTTEVKLRTKKRKKRPSLMIIQDPTTATESKQKTEEQKRKDAAPEA